MLKFAAVAGLLTFFLVVDAGGGRLFEVDPNEENNDNLQILLPGFMYHEIVSPPGKRMFGGFLNRVRHPGILYQPHRRLEKRFVLTHMLDRREHEQESKRSQNKIIPPSRFWWRHDGKRNTSGFGLSPAATFFMDKKFNRFLFGHRMLHANEKLEKRMSFGHLMSQTWQDLANENSKPEMR